MRRFIVLALMCLISAGTLTARAQVAPSATRQQLSLTAGGLGSLFQPDYAGSLIAQTSPNHLYGVGAYVDVKFRRWFQLEGEARWLRFNEYLDINEDNYLIGPRLPIHHFRLLRATPYAKVLFGMGKMNFEYNYAYGHFTDIAYGGGVDIQATKRISIRAFDFEYQQWPNWVGGTLSPYGGSVGIGYKFF
jgi:hypothetical protein